MVDALNVGFATIGAGVLRDLVMLRCALLGKMCNGRPGGLLTITISYVLAG